MDFATKRLAKYVEVAMHSRFRLADLANEAGCGGVEQIHSVLLSGRPDLGAQIRAKPAKPISHLWVHGPSLAAPSRLVNAAKWIHALRERAYRARASAAATAGESLSACDTSIVICQRCVSDKLLPNAGMPDSRMPCDTFQYVTPSGWRVTMSSFSNSRGGEGNIPSEMNDCGRPGRP